MKNEVLIEVTVNDNDYDRPTAGVRVVCDCVEIASGGIGGEPEDNTIGRDYAWVVPAIEAVAKACGATVVRVYKEEDPDNEDGD